jgi:hypothetical protein
LIQGYQEIIEVDRPISIEEVTQLQEEYPTEDYIYIILTIFYSPTAYKAVILVKSKEKVKTETPKQSTAGGSGTNLPAVITHPRQEEAYTSPIALEPVEIIDDGIRPEEEELNEKEVLTQGEETTPTTRVKTIKPEKVEIPASAPKPADKAKVPEEFISKVVDKLLPIYGSPNITIPNESIYRAIWSVILEYNWGVSKDTVRMRFFTLLNELNFLDKWYSIDYRGTGLSYFFSLQKEITDEKTGHSTDKEIKIEKFYKRGFDELVDKLKRKLGRHQTLGNLLY